MAPIEAYLPGSHPRARWMRMDAASLLKRFFFCEQALIVAQGGWLGHIAPLEVKTTLPRFLWEDAMAADALRTRVFELRYPSRLMEVGEDAPLVELFEAAVEARGPEAFVLALATVYKPALLQAYTRYQAQADEIADGPTLRFLRAAIEDKTAQVAALPRFAQEMLAGAPERRSEAEAWCRGLRERLEALGGVSDGTTLSPTGRGGHTQTHTPTHPHAFTIAQVPARDPRFYRCRFYWPDNFDANFPYGDGIRLQLRSAVSHLNEVWAVETAGAILYAFAGSLGWEFVFDAARWTYDESRHCRMGEERLRQWGFGPEEIPLGTYIYDSVRGQDPIFRLGMLFFFEPKNIGKKTERVRAFSQYGDAVSQHDMDYDWADETIHAQYGQRWLRALMDTRPEYAGLTPDAIRARCGEWVAGVVGSATPEEHAEVRAVAEAMIGKAERYVREKEREKENLSTSGFPV